MCAPAWLKPAFDMLRGSYRRFARAARNPEACPSGGAGGSHRQMGQRKTVVPCRSWDGALSSSGSEGRATEL